MEVRLEGVRKVFGGNTIAVHDLDLQVRDQEFLTLLGPSGCGKTTTLRMIAGLESPTAGTIWFGDRKVNDHSPASRNVAMVFQSYALYPHMTVRGNLEYPLKKRGVPAGARAEMVNRTAALLQIQELLDRKPRALSGGQQQRVALGRALIRDPHVFLLDEPLSNLDAKLRAYMRVELIELKRRIGKTMIYVTHDQLEAMTMSDRIAVFNHGRLQQIATPDEIYNRPRNRFVAGFVGTPQMNFLAADVTESGVCLGSPPVAIELPGEMASAVRNSGNGRVVVGIRPEDIVVGERGASAEVSVVEMMGHETVLFLDLGGERLVARVGAETHIPAMSRVNLSFRAARLHLFDPATEQRIG